MAKGSAYFSRPLCACLSHQKSDFVSRSKVSRYWAETGCLLSTHTCFLGVIRPTHAFSALSSKRAFVAYPLPPIAGGGHHSLQMRMHLVASAPYRGLITITCVVHMSLRQKLYNPWSEINLKLMYIVPGNTLTSLMRSGAYFSVQHAMTTSSYDFFRTGCAMG